MMAARRTGAGSPVGWRLRARAIALREALDVEWDRADAGARCARIGRIRRAQSNGAARAGAQEHDVDLEDRGIATRDPTARASGPARRRSPRRAMERGDEVEDGCRAGRPAIAAVDIHARVIGEVRADTGQIEPDGNPTERRCSAEPMPERMRIGGVP